MSQSNRLLEHIDYGQVEAPRCDFHKLYNQVRVATYFGPSTEGITAYMCDDCYQEFGLPDSNGMHQSRMDEVLYE